MIKDIDNDLMEDFMEEGWERKSRNSKMITLSKNFQKRPDEEKINYLWKLASSLNQVAVQIQKERNEANSLLFVKEEKLVKCHEGRSQEQLMLLVVRVISLINQTEPLSVLLLAP